MRKQVWQNALQINKQLAQLRRISTARDNQRQSTHANHNELPEFQMIAFDSRYTITASTRLASYMVSSLAKNIAYCCIGATAKPLHATDGIATTLARETNYS